MKRYAVLNTVIYFLVLPVLMATLTGRTLAQEASSSLDATVKVSVCGDFIAEGPEECDNEDIKNATCRSLGYDTGELSCNPDCTLDRSLCTGTAPVPPPPSDDTNDDEDSDSSGSSRRSRNRVTQAVVTITEAVVEEVSQIVMKLGRFDLNNNGILDFEEIHAAMRIWVIAWRSPTPDIETCDVNNDGVCNLKDFSVILYYTDR